MKAVFRVIFFYFFFLDYFNDYACDVLLRKDVTRRLMKIRFPTSK